MERRIENRVPLGLQFEQSKTKRRSMRCIRFTHVFLFGILLTTYAITSGVGKPLNTSESGVEGQVSIGPMCPVVQPDRPCPDKPFAASIEIQKQDDKGDHLTVRSGEDGRFRVKLAPGKYKLTPMAPNPGAPPHAPGPQVVTVESGKYVHVTIKYDSGIR
jgi:hypothetical protein